MWLSRAGVVEQADSAPTAPTLTGATATASFNIQINTSEPCEFNGVTGITISTNTGVAVTASSITGSGDTGLITLSRAVSGSETLSITFAEVNQVVSVSTGLPVFAETRAVVNNAPAFAAPIFQNYVISSASASTSVTSDSTAASATFPPQSSGLKVAFPNWVGYGTEGSAVTDTNITVNYNGGGIYATGAAFTNFTIGAFQATAGSDSAVPYFENNDGSFQERTVTLTPTELSRISLPTVSGKGVFSLDILSLLSTAKQETISLKYTDAVPASAANQGTQKDTFFFRLTYDLTAVNGEVIENIDARTIDVDTEETISSAQSGPVTVVPRLQQIFLSETGNVGNVFGTIGTADNGYNLGEVGADPLVYDDAQLNVVFRVNPYVYNNLTTPPPEPLQFANAMEIRFTSQDASTLTFDAGETGVQLGPDYQIISFLASGDTEPGAGELPGAPLSFPQRFTAGVHNFAIAVTTPGVIDQINAFSAADPSSAPANYITQTVTGQYTVP